MSRCFPYPPPGYTLSKDKIEALIVSIKLRNERQKAKEQRKREKRREKKEKRREKKEKRKEKKHKSNGFLDKSNDRGSDKKLTEDKNICKRAEVENKQFEGSSLTEEHAPFNSHTSSSENSCNKRKRHSSHINDNGFLVRLPSEKQNRCDALLKEQGPSSTSGRTEFFHQNKDDIHLRNLTQRSNEQKFSINGRIEKIASIRSRINSVPDAIKISTMQRMAQEYKNLVENWVPSPKLQDASFYSDDMDWIFNSKNRNMQPEKRHRSGSEIMPCSRRVSLWPRAEYLHEVGVYALPLTIPF